MAIEVNRDQIIYGAATRLSLDNTDLGPTTGAVTVRREVELIDIGTDVGTVIDKFQNRDQMFVEMELAQSTLNNLVVAWGGTVNEMMDADGNVTAIELALDPVSDLESAHQLVIEGPGTDDFVRRYTFPNVVSLVQTEQNIRKDGIISVPIEFEVMMDPQASEEHFGRIDELSAVLSLRIVSGNRQSAVINGTLANPLVVEVQDEDGNLVSGADVEFAVTAGGGTLSAIVDTTDANGQAQATLTLGANIGANTVTATVDEFVVEFTATGQARTATSVHSVSGNGQATVVNGTLANPFVVEVRDQGGNPISDAVVEFDITQGGGSLSHTVVLTNNNGRAQTTLTLGPNLGANTVRASVSGIATTIDFTATGQPSLPTTLHEISGDNQSVVINGTLANPFVVEVRDQIGNPFVGATVNFSVTAGGGSLSTDSAVTDDMGRAGTTLTVGSAIGTNNNSVEASVNGIATTIDFTASGNAQTPTTLVYISGRNQSVVIGGTLANPFVAEVRDEIGNVIEGVTVNFSVTAGGGTLSASSDTTDANGQAETTLTVGAGTGTNIVQASVSVIPDTVQFTASAIAQAPSSLHKISGDNQSVVINGTLANPFVVEVRDQIGNTISDAFVNFAITQGDGSLSHTVVLTNNNGQAQTTLTLGGTAGTNTVQASVSGITDTVDFTATGQPQAATTLHEISGDNQSVVINGTLANPFVVEVRDQIGNPFVGATVNFAVTAGGGTLSASSDTTDADGQAEATLTVGSTIGTNNNSVEASVNGISTTITFTASGNAQTPTTIHKISGDSQSVVINGTLANPFVVEVRDEIGNVIEGVTVNFSVINGGGTLSASSDTTDANGQAETTLTVGSAVGTNTVRAAVSGIISPVQFTASASAQAPSSLHIISGNNQSGVANNPLTNPFVVEVRDVIGNAIEGVAVLFDVVSGGGMLSTATDTTDADGQAETTLTAGPVAGTNVVRVSVSGITDTVDFTATASAQVATSLHSISGNNQFGVINEQLANPFVVEVRDQEGTAMSGVTVNFAIVSGSGILSTATDTTDADGQAETTLTFDGIAGLKLVRATVSGIDTNIDFLVTAQATAASSLHIISGNDQRSVISTELANPYIVEARNQMGDSVAGVNVSFAITQGSGTLSASSDTTDSNGRAETTLTADATVGFNIVRATLTGTSITADFTTPIYISLSFVSPGGLTWDGTSLLVADVSFDDVIAFTNGVVDNGRSIISNVITAANSSIRIQGLAWDGTSVLVLDSQADAVWGFTNRARDSSKDISASVVESASANIAPSGITWDGTSVLILDSQAPAVWGFTNGVRDSTKDISASVVESANASIVPQGITWDGTSVLILDSQAPAVWGFINGARDSNKDILASVIESVNSSINPRGITFVTDGVYIADRQLGAIWFFSTA